jgi:ABC-2 type transport system ATP-binding protein
MELLECKNLCKSYDEKQVLKDVNLKIPKGKIIGLLGKNGMGKTTLIKLINDLLTPTSGEVLINGKKPGVESKKIISYLPEKTYIDREMKVKDAIKYFEEFYDNFDSEKAKKLLKDLELDENSKISKMSKGMQEKLQLILVMSRNAQLYILDEKNLAQLDKLAENYGGFLIDSAPMPSDLTELKDPNGYTFPEGLIIGKRVLNGTTMENNKKALAASQEATKVIENIRNYK